MTESEVLKDLQNYQGILKAKARVNASVNPEIALNVVTEAIEVVEQYSSIGTVEKLAKLKERHEKAKWLLDEERKQRRLLEEEVKKLKKQLRNEKERKS